MVDVRARMQGNLLFTRSDTTVRCLCRATCCSAALNRNSCCLQGDLLFSMDEIDEVPAGLAGVWAYVMWEAAGCPSRSQAQADAEYRSGIAEVCSGAVFSQLARTLLPHCLGGADAEYRSGIASARFGTTRASLRAHCCRTALLGRTLSTAPLPMRAAVLLVPACMHTAIASRQLGLS